MSDEFVLSLLNLLLGLGAKFLFLTGLGVRGSTLAKLESSALGMSLNGIKGQTGVFDILASTSGKVEVRVQSSVPAGKETALNLGVLSQTGLTYTLRGERILLQGRGKRILSSTSVVLMQHLTA